MRRFSRPGAWMAMARMLSTWMLLVVGPAQAQVQYEVFSQTTDPYINVLTDMPHLAAVNPTVTQQNRLIVFFGGGMSAPINYRLFTRHAANDGFHVINLRYINNFSLYDRCHLQATASLISECYFMSRGEVAYGSGTRDWQANNNIVAINDANSILNRLIKLLAYLNATYPGDGWGQYISGNHDSRYQGKTPVWSKVILAGHSQGGGFAAYLADEIAVSRVVTLANPRDEVDATTNAKWISDSIEVTPQADYFGFAHADESRFDIYQRAWAAIGYSGSVTLVDGVRPPYGGSHRLATRAPPQEGTTAADPMHGSSAADHTTPKYADGCALHLPVWRYMYTGGNANAPQWQDTDMGAGVMGHSCGSGQNTTNYTRRIAGSGAGWSYVASDALRFHSKPIGSEGSLTTQLTVLDNVPGAHAGVMIRAGLNADAAFVSIGLYRTSTGGATLRTVARLSAGGTTILRDDPIPSDTPWLKIVRSGNTLTAYMSADGITFTPSYSRTFGYTPPTMYMGFAVASSSTTSTATGHFDNVAYSRP